MTHQERTETVADIRETAKAEAERVYPETEWTNRATVLALREALEQGYPAAWRLRGEADAGPVAAMFPIGCELRPDGTEDRLTAAWVEGGRDSLAAIRALDEGGQ